jgi:hypothetical protein
MFGELRAGTQRARSHGMRQLAVLLSLLAGCYGYPRGGQRVHHVQVDVAVGAGERRTTGVRDDPELSSVAASSMTTTAPAVRWFTPSGHGGGVRAEAGRGDGGPTLRVKAIDAFYAYERIVADGAVSLAGFAGPSRTAANVVNYCYAEPHSIIDFCGGRGNWPPPPDLHAYDQVAWGGVLGLGASARAGSLLLGLDLAWRATRPFDSSPVGWNHTVMAQLRLGLDIAFANPP